MTLRIGYLTSHPIQYQVPIFRLLEQRPDVDFTALFCHLPDDAQQGAGFGVKFQWDIPLLDGYEYVVLRNVSRNPGVTHFAGCDTPEIADQVTRRQFDALVVNGWVVKSCLQGLNACRRRDVPCLVRGEANNFKPRAWWKRTLHRRLVQRYAACLYIGRANAEFYSRHGVAGDRLFFSPYCIENDRLASCGSGEDAQSSARREFDVPEDAACFLFCGKLEPKKHPLELIGAFQQMIGKRGKAHLLIVGEGPLRGECGRAVHANNLPATFAGFLNQSEIAKAYAAADCLVLPSDYGETWGLVVNEAMACGRPAIVSNLVGCHPDLVIEDETGAVVEFGKWDVLAEKLLEFSRDRGRLHAMGRRAQEHIQRYSPQAAADGIVAAARSVAR